MPGFLWCATNAAAISGHIVAHSGVRYSNQDKLFQPCCHPRLWASSAHVFTAANADTAFFGVFPNLLQKSGQNKSQRDVSCYARKYLSHPKILYKTVGLCASFVCPLSSLTPILSICSDIGAKHTFALLAPKVS